MWGRPCAWLGMGGFTHAARAIGLPALPTPRYGLQAVALGGIVYAIGGSAWHVVRGAPSGRVVRCVANTPAPRSPPARDWDE